MADRVGCQFEGLQAETAHAGNEGFTGQALGAVGVEQRFHHVGHFRGGKGGADDLAGHGQAAERAAVGAAQRDLVPLAAVLVHAQDADVAGVVVAAGVHAAADVQVNGAQVEQFVEVLVALGDGLRQRNGAGIGQSAQVAAGAGDHVGEQANVGFGHA